MDIEKSIDNVQEIRTKNNSLWMDIVRVAMRANPEHTKKILREIIINDQDISKIIKKISKAKK